MWAFDCRFWRVAAVAAVLSAAMAGGAWCEALYAITSVTSEQLNNAVRVKVEADGAIQASVSKWYDTGYYLDFKEINKQTTSEWLPECYPQVDKIYVHLNNALPQCGSVVHVGQYPVSDVLLTTTTESGGKTGLDLVVMLQRLMRFRKFQFARWNNGWDAYLWDHHDPAWFDVVQSSDQRSLIITVASDMLPEVREHRKPDDVPEGERELKVYCHCGMLNVQAKAVKLTDLVEAVSKVSSRQMSVDPATERLVTAGLTDITPDEFAERIAQCYGLALNGSPEHRVFSDIIAQTSTAYYSGKTERIPVRYIKADKARALLPNFLLDYARVDEERNALVVSGSSKLTEKIRADLGKIDQPAARVTVRAIVIESSSAADLSRELGLGYENAGLLGASDPDGEIVFSKLPTLGSEFYAGLTALEAKQKAKTVAESSLTVDSGETGEMFAGVDKYISFRRRIYDYEDVAEPVSVGVKLSVTPWTGGGPIMMKIDAQVNNVGEVDPANGLPAINSRTVQGYFRVNPGETVAIGGLTQVETQTVRRRIPILGYLPLIGSLFTHKVKRQTRSEITVFITPETL